MKGVCVNRKILQPIQNIVMRTPLLPYITLITLDRESERKRERETGSKRWMEDKMTLSQEKQMAVSENVLHLENQGASTYTSPSDLFSPDSVLCLRAHNGGNVCLDVPRAIAVQDHCVCV